MDDFSNSSYASDARQENTYDQLSGDEAEFAQEPLRPASAPYVHQHRPRKTIEAIDNLKQDDSITQSYAHDSNVAVGGKTPLTGLSGLAYHRSRSDMGKIQRDLHYGQYLEIPKGKRQIFASRQRNQQIRSRAIMVSVIVVLAIVAFCIWRMVAGF